MSLSIVDVKIRKVPFKGCPKCKAANPAAIHKCTECGYDFMARFKKNSLTK